MGLFFSLKNSKFFSGLKKNDPIVTPITTNNLYVQYDLVYSKFDIHACMLYSCNQLMRIQQDTGTCTVSPSLFLSCQVYPERIGSVSRAHRECIQSVVFLLERHYN